MPIDLNDPEIKAAIADAVEAATEGLKANNAKLLKEKRALASKDAVNPEEYETALAQMEKLADELKQTKKAAMVASKDLEAARSALDAETKAVKKHLIESGLMAGFAANSITVPAHQKALLAMLSQGSTVEDDGNGGRVAKLNGKPLADALKEFAGSEDGKAFVSASGNQGGGGAGSTGKRAASASDGKRAVSMAEYRERIASNNPFTQEELKSIRFTD